VRRIAQAALERARSLAEASLREMGRALRALPVSEATIDELDQVLRDAEASPPPWQVPWRRQAIDIITARRAEIAASLNRQEAGTLAGRI